MKPIKFVATSALLLVTAVAGVAQADLASDLKTMSIADALAKAANNSSMSVEALIADASSQLKNNPGMLVALINQAIKAYPQQSTKITQAVIAQLADYPDIQAQVIQGLNAPAAGSGRVLPASEPPPPPAARRFSLDKPPAVSPN